MACALSNACAWQIDFRAPSGQRVRCSAETTDRKAAQEYHDKLKADLWRRDKLGEMPDKVFEEAAVRFWCESAGQRDYATKKRHVAFWREKFEGRPVRSLTSDDIVDALPTHRIHRNKAPTPLTGATRSHCQTDTSHVYAVDARCGPGGCVHWIEGKRTI